VGRQSCIFGGRRGRGERAATVMVIRWWAAVLGDGGERWAGGGDSDSRYITGKLRL
jgi:hypothetical protein